MPRGGRRAGTPGMAYGNRTDLNQQRQTPIMRVGGQPYGAQAEQVRAQKAVPAGPSPAVSPTTPGFAAPPVTPTQVVPISAPTMRPNEPVTAGTDLGPGVGAPPPTLDNAETIRQWMPALERLASMPEASAQTRNFVRFLRASI